MSFPYMIHLKYTSVGLKYASVGLLSPGECGRHGFANIHFPHAASYADVDATPQPVLSLARSVNCFHPRVFVPRHTPPSCSDPLDVSDNHSPLTKI